jgi:hypothetical protein
MGSPKTEAHVLPVGEFSFKAPLTYYISETDSIGRLNLTKENANKKFFCIPIPD